MTYELMMEKYQELSRHMENIINQAKELEKFEIDSPQTMVKAFDLLAGSKKEMAALSQELKNF
jgi:hypothetical protein